MKPTNVIGSSRLCGTQRKQVCYFDTQECAKQMSPVSAHYTCAVVKRVLN